MNICISVESAADLSKELIAKYGLDVIPFTLVLGDKQGYDGDVTAKDLFEYTDKNGKLPHTSAINTGEFNTYFEKLLKTYDCVIHLSLSSGISSACQNAMIASSSFGEGKIYVIDTHSLSTGIALLAIYAAKLRDAGKTPEEIVSLVKERLPFDQTSFALESVNYLYKGGRCSALAALGANLLRLKPQIIMKTKDGKMTSGKKFRGPIKKWVMDYVEETLKEFNNPDKSLIFVTHTIYENHEVVDMVKERLVQEGFETIYETYAGGTISCHCGPNCLGILYLNDGEHLINK